MAKARVVVVGGGYAGLACLRGLASEVKSGSIEVLLIDSSPSHAIKSRFHERVFSRLREPGISFSLKKLAAIEEANFINDEILSIDFNGCLLAGRFGEYSYDVLVLAMGGRAEYYGIVDGERHSHAIDTLDAVRRCEADFRELMRKEDGRKRVIVCGAGIEGIEVSTQLRQAAASVEVEITIVDGGKDVLPRAAFPSEREHAVGHLKQKGINLVMGRRITSVEKDCLHLDSGEVLPAELIIWCGGVSPPSLKGLESRRPLLVDEYLRSEDFPEVFAVGDCSALSKPDRYANLASAQRAVYQGSLCARNVINHVSGRPLEIARYRPIGELVALGDYDAVGEVRGFKVKGVFASALKKANEIIYIAELFRHLPVGAARKVTSIITEVFGRSKER